MITDAIAMILQDGVSGLSYGQNLFTEQSDSSDEMVVISTTNNAPDSGYNTFQPITRTAAIQIRIHNMEIDNSFDFATRIETALQNVVNKLQEMSGTFNYHIYYAWLENGPTWIPRRVSGGSGFLSMNYEVRYRRVD